LVRACCRPPAYHEPTVRSGRLHTTAFLVSPGYGICRLQISGQIPWMYVRVCILVPLTVHERSDHCETAHAEAQT
jgi:hypothetical protein